MIEPISYRRVITIRDKLPTVGSEPLLSICDDYQTYYVKNDRHNIPAISIINEVLCHYLLELWCINTPDICIINLEKETLKNDYGVRHKASFYERLAFGSKEQEGAFDASEFLQIKGKIDFKKYYCPEMFAHIGLFDMWLENEDRPPELKNLMLFENEELYHFLAIDNAMAFRTGAYKTLTDNTFWATENAYILQSLYFRQLKRFLKLDKEWCRKQHEYFYLCIMKCKRYFTDITQLLPSDWGLSEETKKDIYNYLFDEERNKAVFNEYIRMWK